MKLLAGFLLLCVACVAQERIAPTTCPIMIGVAGTNVPIQGSNHILVWYKNQTGKTIVRSDFEIGLFDGAGHRYSAAHGYSVDEKIEPSAGGLLVQSAQDEQKHLGRVWSSVRGLEVTIRRVRFADGTQWEPAGLTCNQSFRNDEYIDSMRRWNTELRLDWNRTHPNEPIPGSLVSPLLDSK